MMPLALIAAVSFKKEIRVVLITLGVLVSLPIIALVSVTDLGALADPTVTLYTAPTATAYTGGGYDFGYCTYWASMRRSEIGKPIPNNWGNANTWDDFARGAGYEVDHSPATGAIMQTDAGPLGHVAFVETVGADGSWTVSEMNYKGWDEIDNRTIPRKSAQDYNFIH
jgi:surface antigen